MLYDLELLCDEGENAFFFLIAVWMVFQVGVVFKSHLPPVRVRAICDTDPCSSSVTDIKQTSLTD